ncbi:MAG: alpha/beta hydrolase [Lachnospiraceae bacterium]|nr:alpha/beta hydrolase [Lachnospiraceae bacterium]
MSGVDREIFTAEGREAILYRAERENRPLIVYHGFAGDGSELWETPSLSSFDYNLLHIGKLDWNRDMTPWPAPAVMEKGEAFTGGADAWLKVLLSEILPEARKLIRGVPCLTGIAGYSLAGMFALYAMHQCDAFDCAASISGSLWFPDFCGFVMSHPLKRQPVCLYLSLGKEEAKTGNPVLQTVRERTEELAGFYRNQGQKVIFEMNPGNHFRNAIKRSARGIEEIIRPGKSAQEAIMGN